VTTSPFPGLTLAEFDALPLSARVAAAAAPYLGYRYSLDKPGAAYASGAMPSGFVARGTLTNCSTFTSSVLMAVYPRAPWTMDLYRQLQVSGTPFVADSPIRAVDAVGVGQAVLAFTAGDWHLVQAWRGVTPPAGGGHAFFVYALTASELIVLEASGNAQGGPGPRMIRRDVEWMRSTYRHLHLARLWP